MSDKKAGDMLGVFSFLHCLSTHLWCVESMIVGRNHSAGWFDMDLCVIKITLPFLHDH